ncbi:PP2C family serine/threonine-protein phosphatase [Endozoicomonas arenosclerae]|uniref:PP2C family serine/threonine-protein phosphatase n=1 Tax=Endozoicomonas arenosclerae TaxID=1633495 RepID=UPI000781AEB8|nr:PP2C family protein-serine/threonine phosphatase [Endozoicomonas arenosclerae]
MAMSYTGVNYPRLDKFNEQLEKLANENDLEQTLVGMDRSGHLITKAQFEKKYGSWGNTLTLGFSSKLGFSGPSKDGEGETFESYERNLQRCIEHYRNKVRLMDRRVSKQVEALPSQFSLATTVNMATELSEAPSKPFQNRAFNSPVVAMPEFTEGGLKTLLDFLASTSTQDSISSRSDIMMMYSLDHENMVKLYKLANNPAEGDATTEKKTLQILHTTYSEARKSLSHAPVQVKDEALNTLDVVLETCSVHGESFERSTNRKRYPSSLNNPSMTTGDLDSREYKLESLPAEVNACLTGNLERAARAQAKEGPSSSFEKLLHPDDPAAKETPKLKKVSFIKDRFVDMQVVESRDLGTATAMATGAPMYGMEDFSTSFRCYCRLAGKIHPLTVTAVFDGHNGDMNRHDNAGQEPARLAASKLHETFKERMEEQNSGDVTRVGVYNAMAVTPVDLDREKSFQMQGSTALFATVLGNQLWVSNVGDCRAFMVREDGSCQPLTEDARLFSEDPEFAGDPEHAKEPFNAILHERSGQLVYHPVRSKDGTHIKAQGPSAPYAVSSASSLGDHNQDGILTARGVVTHVPLESGDANSFLVLCSDGATEEASTAQMMELINTLKSEKPDITPGELAANILYYTYTAGSKDNITVTVLPLNMMSRQF